MLELSLNILDIAQNSVAANAKNIYIEIELENSDLIIRINDDGKGMDKETLNNVQDPFFTSRTTRKIGMGIPFFKSAAEMTGGSLLIESEVNVGTKITAVFNTEDIDFMPVGDIWDTVCTLIQFNNDIEFVYKVKKGNAEFVFDTKEVKTYLETDTLSEFEVIEWIKEYIKENQFEILKREI